MIKKEIKLRGGAVYFLAGSVLLVTVIQYMLLTGLVHPVNLVSRSIQLFCYMLLAAATFRGLIRRAPLAWLVIEMMLAALFAFSLLFVVVSTLLSLRSENFWTLTGWALLASVLNGLLLGILFSLPVCEYFCSDNKSD